MADHLLQETGGLILLEDGSGSILLEQQPVSTGNYLVHETDGTSRFTLEDGTGSILLEAAPTPTPEVVHGGGIIIPRRRLVTRLRREGFEEDEAIALALLLRTRRVYRPD